jgi:2-polyprenyl-3-methyl-5-hydroxy-6-metoxy-1,4-benzoquinol methylase
MNYRSRIYERYYETSYGAVNAVTEAGIRNAARGLRSEFGRWLPADRGARILDAACGVGYALMMLKDAGYTNVHGVDVSPDQVQNARKLGLAVEQGDVLGTLRAQPAHWDCILGIDFIEHLTKDELMEFLDVARAALAPGGRLIVRTPNANSPIGPRSRYRDLTHELIFTEQSLREAFLTCGLRPVAIVGGKVRPFTALGWARGLVTDAFKLIWRAWMVAELGREGQEMPLELNLVGVAEPA